MATVKKASKSPAKKAGNTVAKKASKTAAKKTRKTAAKNSASAKRRAPRKTTGVSGKSAAKRSARRMRDGGAPVPSVWIAGTLEVVDGKLGFQTDVDFIPMEDVAAFGQAVGLIFRPGEGESGEPRRIKLSALADFIDAYGLAAITGVVTTCRRGP